MPNKRMDEKWMKRALDLARRGEGWTSPNPMVGAVIVKDGRVVGEGFHQKAGTPHAEVHALNAAQEKAKGAFVYVNLEPCCHQGRTPPCTDALIQAGVAKVVVAMEDPNPQIAGRGIKRLREAGIEVVTGVLAQEAGQLNEVFIKGMTSQKIFVAMKSAVTLDGKTASRSGSSKWITGEEAREFAHRLRHRYDAILVGIGTVLADNPRLTTRIPGLKNPLRVVLDASLRISTEANLLDTQTGPTLVFTCMSLDGCPKAERIREKGVELIQCPGDAGKVELERVLKVLWQKGVTSLLVEGGGSIHGAFFDQQLVDKIYLFAAPKLVGGHLAPGMIGGVGMQEMKEAVPVEDLTVERIGKDFLFIGYPKFRGENNVYRID